MLCRDGACEGAFRVSEISAFGSCGRRMDVVPADAAATRLLAPLLLRSEPHASGLFELRFRLYWPPIEQDLIAALTQDLGRRGFGMSDDGKPLDLASSPAGDMTAMLTKAYGRDWIKQISMDASEAAVRIEKRKLEQAAAGERWLNLSRWAAFWGSFLFVLAIFLHSIHLFFLRLYHGQSLLAPLLMQAGIGAVCIGIPFFTRLELWPGLFLLPALVTILLAQAWAWLRHEPTASPLRSSASAA